MPRHSSACARTRLLRFDRSHLGDGFLLLCCGAFARCSIGGNDGLSGGVGERPGSAKGRRNGTPSVGHRSGVLSGGFLGGEFAFGETLGGEAQVSFQGDGGVALAGRVAIAPLTVVLLPLVASTHGFPTLGL